MWHPFRRKENTDESVIQPLSLNSDRYPLIREARQHAKRLDVLLERIERMEHTGHPLGDMARGVLINKERNGWNTQSDL
jgi:hypothetical protein